MKNFITSIGSRVLEILHYCGSLSLLTVNSLKKIIGGKKKENLLKHINEIGVASFPLVGVIALFIGMVMVMETAYTLKQFGAEVYAGGIVSISMVRELGPVFIALVMAGRVGGSTAAEIGMMKITEQIDALRVTGVDPVAYLISPRVLAAIISLPSLFILSFFLAILGGFIVGVYIVGIPSGMFLFQSFRFITTKDFISGITKSVVFAVVVINTASHEGLRASGGSAGVGKATTNSVVVSFFLIIFTNLILTGLFYFS